jgi:D-3-phosphoglycerate dehydrogenase / 2-oxoglutarate reductase
VFKTLVANRFHHESLLRLKSSGLTEVYSALSLSELKEHFASTNALLIRSGTTIDDSNLKNFPELQVIISATSGFDHIDFRLCEKHNIKVMHTPNANAISAAEHTMGLMIASARKYGVARDNIKMGNWDRQPLMGFELHGKTLGIIGYGRIGQRVAMLAKAFGMNILIHDPYVEQEKHPGETFQGLEEVFRNSDIITFHVPLTKETYHMIKPATLEWLSPQALMINASRGAVVCSHSLQNHLVEFKSFLAGLDVFETEPLSSDSNLVRNPNMFSTPHIGATTTESIARASEDAIEKLITYIQTKTTSDPVPPQTNWADKLY